MPVMKGKRKNILVYRPAGTKYAEGYADVGRSPVKVPQVLIIMRMLAIEDGYKRAAERFWAEFGRMPNDDHIVESVFADGKVHVTLIEIPEE